MSLTLILLQLWVTVRAFSPGDDCVLKIPSTETIYNVTVLATLDWKVDGPDQWNYFVLSVCRNINFPCKWKDGTSWGSVYRMHNNSGTANCIGELAVWENINPVSQDFDGFQLSFTNGNSCSDIEEQNTLVSFLCDHHLTGSPQITGRKVSGKSCDFEFEVRHSGACGIRNGTTSSTSGPPTVSPTPHAPTTSPTAHPSTTLPSPLPTASPSALPTIFPSVLPTISPSALPTRFGEEITHHYDLQQLDFIYLIALFSCMVLICLLECINCGMYDARKFVIWSFALTLFDIGSIVLFFIHYWNNYSSYCIGWLASVFITCAFNLIALHWVIQDSMENIHFKDWFTSVTIKNLKSFLGVCILCIMELPNMWFFVSQSFAWRVASAPMPERSQQQLINFSAWSSIIKNAPRLAILAMMFGVAEHGSLPHYSSKTQTLLSISLEDASFVMVLFSTGVHFILGSLTCCLVKIIPSEVQNTELDEQRTQTNPQINQTTQLNFTYNDQRKIVAYIDNHSDDSTESVD